MMAGRFTTPLSITSQFGFCGLPLRLDSYAGCSFQCTYCFARARGGNTPSDFVRAADPGAVRRVFERSLTGGGSRVGFIGQFLRQRVPVHFGGMSDPFQKAELKHRVSAQILEIFRTHKYPLVI